MKKILFVISERDYFSAYGRLSYLLQRMSVEFEVTVITDSEGVKDDILKGLQGKKTVTVQKVDAQPLPITFDFRNNLAKAFVRYTHDLTIPGTDLKIWKTAAFDDFWGHITTCSFPELSTIDADLVLLPLISYDDTPWQETDFLYTHAAFRAKEANKKVVGLQLFPVFNTLLLMAKLVDAIILKDKQEEEFYIRKGFREDTLHVLTDDKDVYSLTTIDDVYKNHMYNSQLDIGPGEMAVAITNHMKYRPQIREAIGLLGESKLPVVLLLIKREYAVRDLHEDQIIRDIYFDDIRRSGCKFYLIEQQSTVPTLMVSDVIISPVYAVPLEFAAHYGKTALVYNPYFEDMPDFKNVSFINKPSGFIRCLKNAYDERQKRTTINKTLEKILKG